MSNDMAFGSCSYNYIFGIHILFDNFENPANIELDDALELASSYLPCDILKSHYKLNYSTSYKAIKSSENNDCYYDISYSPIDTNSYGLALGDYSYDYPNINITFRENSKKYITDIWIDLHQSMCNYGRNSIAYCGDYKESKWSYDFLSK